MRSVFEANDAVFIFSTPLSACMSCSRPVSSTFGSYAPGPGVSDTTSSCGSLVIGPVEPNAGFFLFMRSTLVATADAIDLSPWFSGLYDPGPM